jgi:NADH:ubiquinone oxidoreductase subunit 6 (subunit J)
MAQVFFFLAAIGAVGGALATVILRNPFYSVLALVCHLLSLAALFLLLRAEFLAAAQVIVYVGAVMVLYLFVVAYVGGAEEPMLRGPGRPGLRWASLLFAGALFIELAIATLGSGLDMLGEKGAGFFPGFGSPEQMGRLFLTDFLLAFELASMLLLVAAVGAVVLARRRVGLEDPREISVADLMRGEDAKGTLGPGETGSLVEAGGPEGR